MSEEKWQSWSSLDHGPLYPDQCPVTQWTCSNHFSHMSAPWMLTSISVVRLFKFLTHFLFQNFSSWPWTRSTSSVGAKSIEHGCWFLVILGNTFGSQDASCLRGCFEFTLLFGAKNHGFCAQDDNDEIGRSPGTPVFTAPECCLGEQGTLAFITVFLLCRHSSSHIVWQSWIFIVFCCIWTVALRELQDQGLHLNSNIGEMSVYRFDISWQGCRYLGSWLHPLLHGVGMLSV